MLARCEPLVEFRRGRKERHQRLGYTAVFLAGLLDDARLHEILELFVGSQPQHFLAAAGQIPRAEVGMNDVEKRLELQGSLFRENSREFLSDSIGTTEGKTEI